MREVKWLIDLAKKASRDGYADNGKVCIGVGEDETRLYHMNTLILLVENGEIVSLGGAYSITDARYINNILALFHPELAAKFTARKKGDDVYMDANKEAAHC